MFPSAEQAAVSEAAGVESVDQANAEWGCDAANAMIASETTMTIWRGPDCRRAETQVSIIRLFDSLFVSSGLEWDRGSYPTFTHSDLQSGVALNALRTSARLSFERLLPARHKANVRLD